MMSNKRSTSSVNVCIIFLLRKAQIKILSQNAVTTFGASIVLFNPSIKILGKYLSVINILFLTQI
jgi:hypothetical protein